MAGYATYVMGVDRELCVAMILFYIFRFYILASVSIKNIYGVVTIIGIFIQDIF
jgi:hypothetical protein